MSVLVTSSGTQMASMIVHLGQAQCFKGAYPNKPPHRRRLSRLLVRAEKREDPNPGRSRMYFVKIQHPFQSNPRNTCCVPHLKNRNM